MFLRQPVTIKASLFVDKRNIQKILTGSYLTDRTFSIRVDDVLSEQKRIRAGVCHGFLLGTELFILYAMIFHAQHSPRWWCTRTIQPCTPLQRATALCVLSYRGQSTRYAGEGVGVQVSPYN